MSFSCFRYHKGTFLMFNKGIMLFKSLRNIAVRNNSFLEEKYIIPFKKISTHYPFSDS